MASSIPSQNRAVDPFSSFNSDNVNQLTDMISRGNDGLADYNSMQVAVDSTSPLTKVVVSTGSIFVDSVFIRITAEHTVDFEDFDHYISPSGGFNQSGTYYIVLQYAYSKSKPAPEARIKILKPSQIPHPSVGTSLFFLKAVTAIYNGSTFEISALYDHDPSTPTVKRLYTPLYFGVEDQLPTHVTTRDQGRVLYVANTDSFYFGKETKWIDFSSAGGSVAVTSVYTDTTGLWTGAIAYVDNNNAAQLAISSIPHNRADIGVTSLGTPDERTAEAIIAGVLDGVKIETGYSVQVGSILYLSGIEAGKVTPVKPQNNIQQVGRAITNGNDSTSVSMIFLPRAMISTAIVGSIVPAQWGADSGLYRADVDISGLDASSSVIVTSFFSDTTGNGTIELIDPYKVELIESGGIYVLLRIWMTTNTLEVFYNLSSGTGGAEDSSGGGGGTTNHALLTNLTFASSGHIGFASNPHSNAMHSDPPSVPSGEQVLFRKDTAVANYTLVTSIDDQIVYITKGSASGGETGGTSKSGGTWTQPNHSHTISTQAAHTHTTATHALTISEMPSHNHTILSIPTASYKVDTGGTENVAYLYSNSATGFEGGGVAHEHGDTGSGGSHDHTGATGSTATVNTWRPTGQNFTVQQKI